MSRFSRTDQSVLAKWWWTIDRPMLVSLGVLIVIGIVMVTTASPPVAERIGLDGFYFIKRHLILLIPAIGILLSVSFLSMRNIWRLASVILIGAILATIFVLLFGNEVKGAKRWIYILGISLQPSEFIKVSFAVVTAWFMAQSKEKEKFPGYKITTGLFSVIVLLLLLQPDFGMTTIIALVYGVQIFLAGFPLWLVMVFGVLSGLGAMAAYFMFSHVQSRVDRFLNPESGDNFQVEKSLEAFQSGGLLGTGPGQGEVKLRLPDAHTDFIYAVAGEEFGLIFAIFLLALFAFIVLRGVSKITRSSDLFQILSVSGLLAMFGFQTLVHIGSSVNLIPAKGMTLPFISYGGSSLFSMSMAMGMLLALTRKQPQTSIARGGAISR